MMTRKTKRLSEILFFCGEEVEGLTHGWLRELHSSRSFCRSCIELP